MENKDQKGIISAIIIAGVLIAGAILLKGSSKPVVANPAGSNPGAVPITALAPVGKDDRVLGAPAKVTLIMYEDFQCPFCGKFVQESEQPIRDTYVKNGTVQLVYRDFPFLGDRAKAAGQEDESGKSAEAARCAGDQGKFWEYHDYLFTHQKGENEGAFSVAHLETFAKTLQLDTVAFNQCLDTDKYAQAVTDSKTEAYTAGVTGTPKGFILRDGKIASTIDGAEPFTTVKQKIDAALK